MLLLTNGLVVDPKSRTETQNDILIAGNRIEAIGKNLLQKYREGAYHECECGISDPASEGTDKLQLIDCSNYVIMPGLIDVHAHFRDPGLEYKEDIITGANAAKSGGYTTVVLMANTKPPVDQPEVLKYVLDKGKKTEIRVESCVTVTRGMKGQELSDLEKLYYAGAAGFTDDGVPIMNEKLVREAMELSAKLHAPISFHEEDPAYIGNNGVNHGAASTYFGIEGSPREAEISLVKRDLEIAVETGAVMDVQHVSCKETVALIREAKKKGNNIHAEACPHHFTLTEEDCIRFGTLGKMNPPLRTKEDREAIIEGILDGTLDIIATDHAPHSAEEKAKKITEAPSGIIGLETALPLAYQTLVKEHHMPYYELADRMSYQPALMYGFARRGCLQEGCLADLTIFNPNASHTYDTFASKSQNSPFLNCVLQGVVAYTICDGIVVFEGRNTK